MNKKPNHLILIISILLSLSTHTFAQNQTKTSEAIVIVETDTIFEVDTIQMERDPNMVTLSKAQYDSLLNANKKLSKIEKKYNRKKKNNPYHFDAAFITADYLNLGAQANARYNNSYILLNFGTSFNYTKPIILGVGFGQIIPLNEKFSFTPELVALYYIPTKTAYSIQSNNHLRLGIAYKLSTLLTIEMVPSIYCGWRKNIDSNTEYNQVIHSISPLKPIYAKETSETSAFDIGLGLALRLVYKLK